MKLRNKAAKSGSSPASCCASFVRMFKPQFAEMVERGEKLQTVRPTPKRMPKPGDKISLRTWTGKPYRSKQRVLRDAVVSKVETIKIEGDTLEWQITVDGHVLCPIMWSAFARADGFPCTTDFVWWFIRNHGLPFEGIVIHWQNKELYERA